MWESSHSLSSIATSSSLLHFKYRVQYAANREGIILYKRLDQHQTAYKKKADQSKKKFEMSRVKTGNTATIKYTIEWTEQLLVWKNVHSKAMGMNDKVR